MINQIPKRLVVTFRVDINSPETVWIPPCFSFFISPTLIPIHFSKILRYWKKIVSLPRSWSLSISTKPEPSATFTSFSSSTASSAIFSPPDSLSASRANSFLKDGDFGYLRHSTYCFLTERDMFLVSMSCRKTSLDFAVAQLCLHHCSPAFVVRSAFSWKTGNKDKQAW